VDLMIRTLLGGALIAWLIAGPFFLYFLELI